MTNFTKSIVYSGVVLAAGLVAIFAIYNNMSGTDVAGIEPAAGVEEGTDMMSALAGKARALDCVRFDWTAETSNPRAIDLYQRLGAQVVEEKVYFRMTGEPLAELAARA
ncbi:MAG: hypothetical protein AAF679_01945 [Pseudomonadota bacterium]